MIRRMDRVSLFFSADYFGYLAILEERFMCKSRTLTGIRLGYFWIACGCFFLISNVAAFAAPDVYVDGSVSASPSPVAAGGQVTISYTVRNQGTTAAIGSTTRIQIKDASLNLLSGCDWDRSALGVGASSSVVNSHQVTIPSGTAAGNYTIYIVLDRYNVITGNPTANDYGNGPISIGSGLTIPTVSTVTASSVGSTSATLNGQITSTGGATITAWLFGWGTTSSCSDTYAHEVTINGNNFSYTVTGLTPGQTYYFQAWAQNSVGWGSGSALSFTTTSAAPAPPTPTSPGTASDTGYTVANLTPTLQWTGSSGADYYAVAVYPAGSSSMVYNAQMAYGTSITVPSGCLQTGTKYRWNMQAHSSSGLWSDISSTLYFQTPVPTPSGPSGAPPTSNYFNGNQTEKSGASNDPVNTATGNFLHEETDLTIQTRTNPLEFKRVYNNQDTRTTSLGQGWTHSYYVLLAKDANATNVNVRWGDGHTDYWHYDADTATYKPTTVGLYDKLIKNGDGTWKIIKKNLDTYTFDDLGRLSTIVDKNANMTTLSYNYPSDQNCVTTITDPVGRTITLQYQSGQLTSIADFAARNVTFDYTNGMLTQVTDVLGHPITYAYDTNGNLQTITDQRGLVVVDNLYDSQGRVIQQRDGRNYMSTFAYDTPAADQTTITDPNGHTTVHTHFTGYKLLQSIQDALGQTIIYTYDAQANRTSITDRNDHTTTFNYDARGNVIATLDPIDPNHPDSTGGITTVEYLDADFPDFPTRKIDALGHITQWNYDSDGNAQEQIDPNGNHRYWTYNSFGQKLTETDENGQVAVWTYDTAGRLTQKTDPNGNYTWFGYDSLGRLTDITDGRGAAAGDVSHTTHTLYDNADRVISITDPNTSESYEYDNVGYKTLITNGRGYTTHYDYDENGNLTQVEKDAPNGQKQTFQYTYDNLNRKLTVSDPNANLTTYTYDAVGRLRTETNAAGNQTHYTYDAQGNVLSVTDSQGVKIAYEYDGLNRKVEQYDLLGNHGSWQYDKMSRVIKSTDARGAKTFYGYDVLGRLVSVIDDHDQATHYQYDKVGNLTQVIDAGGVISTKKFYDTANRLVRQEDGNGHAYQYSYDGAGNMISVVDANNQTTTYSYDSHNRLIQINYPDATQATYTYDMNSNLTSTTGIAGTTTYAYDELDRLISSTDCFSKQVQYGYDIVGNRISITYPADSNNPARTVTYNYDQVHRLQSITDWDSRTWSYTVDGAGRLVQLAHPNGVKENRTYDNAGRLSGLTYKQADDAALISYSYTCDGQGNPTNVNETGTLSPNPVLPAKTLYNYDTDNRLTDTDQPASYNYDNNGNLITRTVSGTTTSFSYDVENRLISQSTGGSNVQHIYDSRGHRIARVQNGITTRYVLDYGRDMSQILCETDGTGSITAYYIHGPQIVGRIGTDGSIRYYHSDHIGNIVALTDSSQSISDKYAYTPFGTAAGQQGATANPFTYVGSFGVMADADGLYFMRARFYDPGTGRFLSKDPVEGRLMEPLGLHRYNYALNNPALNIDPTGEVVFFMCIGLTGTGAAGGGAYAKTEVCVAVNGKKLSELNADDVGVFYKVGTGVAVGGEVGAAVESSAGVTNVKDLQHMKGGPTINVSAGGGLLGGMGVSGSQSVTDPSVGSSSVSGSLGVQAGGSVKGGVGYNGKAVTLGDYGRAIFNTLNFFRGGKGGNEPQLKGATYTNVPYSYENDVQAKTWATKYVPGQQK